MGPALNILKHLYLSKIYSLIQLDIDYNVLVCFVTNINIVLTNLFLKFAFHRKKSIFLGVDLFFHTESGGDAGYVAKPIKIGAEVAGVEEAVCASRQYSL